MKPVRVWFKKTGLAVYISHLDLNRCFQRAVIRAGIPLWYTEGFNPKPYLNFLNPLALGQEGLREPLDIRIEGDITLEEIKSRLSAVMPDGIEITDVTEPVMKTAQITLAAYTITVTFATEGEAVGFGAFVEHCLAGGELIAEKKSKRGVKTVNLCEMILRFVPTVQGNTVTVDALLPTGSALSLNPELVLSALEAEVAAEPVSTKISRTGLFTAEREAFV